MISESRYWKEDISRIADKLESRKTQKRWTERSFVNVEKDLFIAFYAIRKLLEAKKLTTSVSKMTLPLFSYPATGLGVTRFNSFNLEKHFDFSQEKTVSLPLAFICNQFIHSYIYSPYRNEEGTLVGHLGRSLA